LLFVAAFSIGEVCGSPPVEIVSSLIDPAKLATLKGDRPANPRFRKLMFHLAASGDPAGTLDASQAALGIAGSPIAREDRAAILRNLVILERLGCLDAEGLAELKKGEAPTIKRGPYAGDVASVDHIIPLSVAPELGNRLFNLEFMPSKLNQRKGRKVGQRQVALAEKWFQEGVLSRKGRDATRSNGRP
jgi:hypothetical protein